VKLATEGTQPRSQMRLKYCFSVTIVSDSSRELLLNSKKEMGQLHQLVLKKDLYSFKTDD
jgi:hypothetical protein